MDPRRLWRRHGGKILAGIAVVLLLFFLLGGGEEEVTYDETVNHSAFVEQGGDGETFVNITNFSRQTGGTSDYTPGTGSYNYQVEEYMTTLRQLGVYNGDTFTKAKFPDGAEEPVMTIKRDFNANDDVVNGYITARIVERGGEDMVEARLYVDEDFRRFANSELNLAWGGQWQNFRSFEFTEVAPGVYMDRVYGNQTRRLLHGSPVTEANFAVGTFSRQDVEQQRYRDLKAAIFLK